MAVAIKGKNARKLKESKKTGKVSMHNADTFTGYLLRAGETGLCCCTDIMDDLDFAENVNRLYEQQKTDFYTQFPPSKIEEWKARDITKEREIEVSKVAADPTYKPKNLDRVAEKRETIIRKDMVFQSKPYYIRRSKKNGETVNRDHAQAVNNLVHKISATQLAIQTTGLIGHQILLPLPQGASKEQIIHILASMRKAIPAGYAGVLTVHKDTKQHNLHIQGWLSSKEWDAETGTWKKYQNEAVQHKTNRSHLESEAGFTAFREACDKAIAQTGLKFKHADDKSLPATSHNKAAYTRYLLQTRSKEDFITGKVKDGIRSERVLLECEQIGARARAIDAKIKKQVVVLAAVKRGNAFFKELDHGRQAESLQKKTEFLNDTDLSKMPLSDALDRLQEQRDHEAALVEWQKQETAKLEAAIADAKRQQHSHITNRLKGV